jgi:hypothetical protein
VVGNGRRLTYFSYFIYLWAGVKPSPLPLPPLIGLLYHPRTIHGDDCGAVSGMDEWQGKRKYWEETCPSAALAIADPR